MPPLPNSVQHKEHGDHPSDFRARIQIVDFLNDVIAEGFWTTDVLPGLQQRFGVQAAAPIATGMELYAAVNRARGSNNENNRLMMAKVIRYALDRVGIRLTVACQLQLQALKDTPSRSGFEFTFVDLEEVGHRVKYMYVILFCLVPREQHDPAFLFHFTNDDLLMYSRSIIDFARGRFLFDQARAGDDSTRRVGTKREQRPQLVRWWGKEKQRAMAKRALHFGRGNQASSLRLLSLASNSFAASVQADPLSLVSRREAVWARVTELEVTRAYVTADAHLLKSVANASQFADDPRRVYMEYVLPLLDRALKGWVERCTRPYSFIFKCNGGASSRALFLSCGALVTEWIVRGSAATMTPNPPGGGGGAAPPATPRTPSHESRTPTASLGTPRVASSPISGSLASLGRTRSDSKVGGESKDVPIITPPVAPSLFGAIGGNNEHDLEASWASVQQLSVDAIHEALSKRVIDWSPTNEISGEHQHALSSFLFTQYDEITAYFKKTSTNAASLPQRIRWESGQSLGQPLVTVFASCTRLELMSALIESYQHEVTPSMVLLAAIAGRNLELIQAMAELVDLNISTSEGTPLTALCRVILFFLPHSYLISQKARKIISIYDMT
jgi:hypothetical protein